MKKLFSLLLAFFVLCISLASCGDGTAEQTEQTENGSPPETTAPEIAEGSPGSEPAGGIWLGLPSIPTLCSPAELEIALSVGSDVYPVDFESIEIEIVNQTGKPFSFSPMICVEKLGCAEIYPYEGDFWIRQPYTYISPVSFAHTDESGRVTLAIRAEYWAEGYTPQPGRYRAVVVIEDVPYTVEFKLA